MFRGAKKGVRGTFGSFYGISCVGKDGTHCSPSTVTWLDHLGNPFFHAIFVSQPGFVGVTESHLGVPLTFSSKAIHGEVESYSEPTSMVHNSLIVKVTFLY